MVRAHIHFYGTVQGVGFRYTTLNFAQQLSLTGWVKNLSDGSVEALIEGTRPDIDKLVAQLGTQFGSYIRDQKVEWMERPQEFDGFSIEF